MFGKFVHQQHRIEKNPRWVGLTRARIKLFTIKLIRDLILTTMVICFFTGIEGDIYYIRDGQIKLNAVNLNMTVPYRVNCLRFIWFSKPVVSIFNTIWRSRCSVFEYNYKHSLNGKVMLLCQLVCQCFNHPRVDHALSGNVESAWSSWNVFTDWLVTLFPLQRLQKIHTIKNRETEKNKGRVAGGKKKEKHVVKRTSVCDKRRLETCRLADKRGKPS